MASVDLRAYLDQVEGLLQGPGKADILREIESHVYDRAEALAAARGAEVGDEDVRRAMGELGDPSDLAISYSAEKHLVTPKEYAAYWYFTVVVFAVHLTTLLLGVVTKTRFGFFPFNVLPTTEMEAAGTALLLLSLAVQAFLFDAGLVLMLFFLLRNTIRRVEMPNLTFRVETSRRQSLFRAAIAIAIAVLLGVDRVRDNFFTVRVGKDAADLYSVFLPGFFVVRPLLLVFLGASFVKDVLYAFLHEKPLTIALDAAAWCLGVATCIYIFAHGDIVGLPADFPTLDETRILLFNTVMGRLVGLFAILLAALFAVRSVRRFQRLRQIWGEKDAESL
jgi:hypothetical protein